MPWGFLLNPLPRGAAGKRKGRKAMAKRRRKSKRAAKTRRRVGTRTKKRRVVKRKRRVGVKRRRRVSVKRATKRAAKAIKRGKRRKLTPFFKFMMAMPGKQSVAKAKKAGKKWRGMSAGSKAKWGAATTPGGRTKAKAASRRRYKKKAKAKRRKSPAYKAWKKRRGRGWAKSWKRGMRKAFKRRGSRKYASALMAGVESLNPFGNPTRRRRVYRKGNPVAKKRRKSRRKARRKGSRRRKFTPIGFMNKRRKGRGRKRRRRNPAVVATVKGMATRGALEKYGYVTAGVVAGAIVPNFIAKAISKISPAMDIDTPIWRAGIGLVGSVLAGAATQMVTKSKDKGLLVAAGGIASVVGALALEQINKFLPATVSGFGYLGATDDDVRRVVEGEIRKELGLSNYVTSTDVSGVGEYATAPIVEEAGVAAGLGLETADDVLETDTFEGGSF